MIIVMKRNAPEEHVTHIIDELKSKGLEPMPLIGTERVVIAVIGDERILEERHIASMPSVSKVMPVLQPFKLASRETKHENTVIDVKGVSIGGDEIVVMAGPCSVENHEQMVTVARAVKNAGAQFLRGGAFKPRTSPHSFQGLGEEGLKMMEEVANENGLITISEVLDPRHVELVAKHIDIFQIGARNMQNFELLKEVGKSSTPVMLKRGSSSTIKEFLLAAEYIMSEGNMDVILCERGIRTFETDTRNTLPLATVPVVKKLSHLPVIIDPSHGVGVSEFVAPMSKAAIACGADGLIIEVHPNPEKALTDGDQSLTTEEFAKLMDELPAIANAVGRKM